MTDGLGLEGAYSETINRINEQGEEGSRLGIAALMWISHAERPLKVDELCHALGVEIGSADLDGDSVPSIGTVLACCQGLVSVNEKASTVRLIHFTLQEYLRAHPKLFNGAHSTMAETCLSFLSSHWVKALSASPFPVCPPFLKYSSLCWGVHAKRDLSDCATQLALNLFNDYNNHISTEILLDTAMPRFSYIRTYGPSLFSGLHCASFFGIVEIVAFLVDMGGCDINQTDCTGSTPLAWAAKNGHDGVVKILLRRGDVNPDNPDPYGRTPLLWAAGSSCEGVAEILLGRGDVNPNNPDQDGRTPLAWAALNGYEGVVKILLRRDDINPNNPDKDGRTPLLWAAMNGHEGVVKILLGRGDVDPNNIDQYGRTPLAWAAMNGHAGVVKILLGRGDVNPDNPDKYGLTPLSWAASKGREEVAEVLLERGDVNPGNQT